MAKELRLFFFLFFLTIRFNNSLKRALQLCRRRWLYEVVVIALFNVFISPAQRANRNHLWICIFIFNDKQASKPFTFFHYLRENLSPRDARGTPGNSACHPCSSYGVAFYVSRDDTRHAKSGNCRYIQHHLVAGSSLYWAKIRNRWGYDRSAHLLAIRLISSVT